MTNLTDQELLSNVSEIFQSCKIGKSTVILTIKDSLKLGDVKDADFRNFKDIDNPDSRLYLFAEHLTLIKNFDFNGGVISAHEIINDPNSDASINSSGENGDSVTSVNLDENKNPGDKGSNGADAGEVFLYCESISNPDKLKFIAIGGKGGKGQDGTLKTAAGNGGDAGNGGKIIYISTNKFLQTIHGLRGIISLSNSFLKQAKLNDFLSSIKDDKDFVQDVVTSVNNALDILKSTKDNSKSINDKADKEIHRAILALQAQSDAYLIDLQDIYHLVNSKGGEHGWGGVGTPNGKDGKDGKDAQSYVKQIANSRGITSSINNPFFFTHPSQLLMLLEKAKLKYFAMGLGSVEQDVITDLTILLNRIKDRSYAFKDLDSSSQLYKVYSDNELSFGVSGAVSQLSSICTNASNYINQLAQGQNFFGYDNDYVPMVSYSEYESVLGKLMASFRTVETSYKEYYADLYDIKKSSEALRSTRSKISDIKNNNEADIGILKEKLVTEAQNIVFYQSTLKEKKDAVLKEMMHLKHKLEDHFDFNMDNFFSSMSMLAFAPESKMMIGTEASKILYDGLNKITTDDGIQVDKSYVIRSLTQVESDFDALDEGYAQNSDGTVSENDLSGHMLITEENKFFSLMDKFYNSLSAYEMDKMKLLFERYVDTVTNRNNHILTYNATLALILNKQGLVKQAKANLLSLNNEAIEELARSGLNGLFAYVSHVYYSLRFSIMEVLDLTQRAFRFWALSDQDFLNDRYASESLSSVNYTMLSNIRTNLLLSYLSAINNFGTGSNPFPYSKDGEGILLKLDEYAVYSLQNYNKFDFSVPEVYSGTSKDDSSFADHANVRLSKVRVWIKGAKTTDDVIRVDIKHTGKESIVDSFNKKFDFQHDKRFTNFEYNLKDHSISQDGNIGYENMGEKELYSLVGPFATWNIEVSKKHNSGLDLSKVTEILVEFHGSSYAFKV